MRVLRMLTAPRSFWQAVTSVEKYIYDWTWPRFKKIGNSVWNCHRAVGRACTIDHNLGATCGLTGTFIAQLQEECPDLHEHGSNALY